MTLLFRNLRIHQVFGANTEVGKTVFTTALCRVSSHLGEASHYLKPVGTGGHGDDWHVSTFSKGTKSHCLHYFHEPVSPHLAVERAQKKDTALRPPSDNEVNAGIQNYAAQIAKSARPNEFASLLVETAGGVHSPTLSGNSQVEAYRPLRLPAVLIASPHLGGISTTISAYESLLLRGFDIDAMLCFENGQYENHEYLRKWCEERHISFSSLAPPPEPVSDRTIDNSHLQQYYDGTVLSGSSGLLQIVQNLQVRHQKRLEDLDSAGHRTRQSVWWPFVQHAHVQKDEDVMVIDSAHKDKFAVYQPSAGDIGATSLKQTYDGSASWWTQCLGHANSDLTLAASYAAGRYGHVIFPNATHAPALELSERLVREVGKGWADRVFFSDNGSTGMEVALKMALRYSAKQMRQRSEAVPGKRVELSVLGQYGSYHGDTIGAMDACEGGVYSASVEWYRGRGFWLDAPTLRLESGVVTIRFPQQGSVNGSEIITMPSFGAAYNVVQRLADPSDLAVAYRNYIVEQLDSVRGKLHLGALIIEPVLMGAGGMLFVDPLFQRILVDIAREMDLPVIFDEVFIGLYRLGRMSGSSFLGVNPDIACYAKILTGGLLPLSVTLANQKIYDVFLDEQKQEALLHGHSYTAHPIGCAVANKTLQIIETIDRSGQSWNEAKETWADGQMEPGDAISSIFGLWDRDFLKAVSELPHVDGAMSMGTVLVIYLKDKDNAGPPFSPGVLDKMLKFYAGYQSNVSASLLHKLRYPPDGSEMPIHSRPLGNTVYWMCSLNTAPEILRQVERRILEALQI